MFVHSYRGKVFRVHGDLKRNKRNIKEDEGARLAERSLPLFKTLKNITKENKDEYRWTKEAEAVFQSMKRLIMELISAMGSKKPYSMSVEPFTT
nr:reverse transcriptase domain-containing protein [Tanacetum cinerariifolium]